MIEWLFEVYDSFANRRSSWWKRICSSRCAHCGARAYALCHTCHSEKH